MLLLLACAPAIAPLAAGAQVVPLGPEFQVNTYTTSTQLDAAVAMGPAGEFVVVWESFGSSGTDTEASSIQAQQFDPDGVPIGSQFQVNTYTTSSQRYPAVAIGPDGELIVVWESDGSSGTDDLYESITGQRFGSDGLPIGTEFQVNTYTTEAQCQPAVAVGPRGEFVVVWDGYGSSGTDNDVLDASVHGQRFGSDGSPVGTEFQVNVYTTDNQLRPSIAMGPAGEFVVVWDSFGSSGTDDRRSFSLSVQGQRFDSDGSFVGTAFQVNTYTTLEQRRPSVAMGPAGEFVVVWESYGSSGTDGFLNSLAVLGQRFGSDGSPVGTEFQANTYTTDDQDGPSVAMGSAGEFVVVWQSGGSGGTDHAGGILAQLFGSDGIPIGTEFQVSATSSQSRPAIAMGEDSAFVVTWDVFLPRDPTGDFFDVKGERFRTTVTSSPCGDADADHVLAATDALIALRASVGSGVCDLCRCDSDTSGTVTATDALRILRRAVGQSITLSCPAC